ncbi:hypothetical protein [Vibrio sp. SCSIO 43137]|uniref:hypothetical protein n=1 Tax=Vibrio sp. SCSIO 43137 TaxID=3021011 RepID=UPI0023074D80|nr:hypothetical protein [Vibrio sp. SCSIO 43137]WCE32094.1 hypothetical protein PK654_16440 [Vibrio sp. SCSIO 43137]
MSRKAMLNKPLKTTSLFVCLLLLFHSGLALSDCRTSDIIEHRNQAMQANKTGVISDAEAILSGYMASDCSFYDMSQNDDYLLNHGLWLISDLMLYRYKLNDPIGCLSLGNEVYDSWMVSEPSRHNGQVENALQTNLKLCKNALAKQYHAPESCPVKGYEHMYAFPANWKESDDLYFEFECISFVENSENKLGGQRDGEKYQSEGLHSLAKFDVLFVSQLKPDTTEGIASDIGSALKQYQLDKLYITSEGGELWGEEYCYSFELRFASQPGELLLDGSAFSCNGGNAVISEKNTIQLELPFRAKIIRSDIHAVK